MIRGSLVGVLVAVMAQTAFAQVPQKSLERLDLVDREGTSDAAIVPIFSQLLLYARPDEFNAAGTVGGKPRIVQRAVLASDHPGRWSQMITVSGDEAAAFGGRSWPRKRIDDFVARTREACPGSFSTVPIGGVSVGSYETAVGVAGCGSSGGRSETTMQIVIKGGMDVYTIEWTLRGSQTRGPLQLEPREWTDRIRRLGPIRLCSIEPPPYPNCLKRR